MIKNLSVSKAQPGPIKFSHQPGVVLSCIKYMYIQVTYIVQFCITVRVCDSKVDNKYSIFMSNLFPRISTWVLIQNFFC